MSKIPRFKFVARYDKEPTDESRAEYLKTVEDCVAKIKEKRPEGYISHDSGAILQGMKERGDD